MLTGDVVSGGHVVGMGAFGRHLARGAGGEGVGLFLAVDLLNPAEAPDATTDQSG